MSAFPLPPHIPATSTQPNQVSDLVSAHDALVRLTHSREYSPASEPPTIGQQGAYHAARTALIAHLGSLAMRRTRRAA
jgi:hypothetical protein